MLDALIASYREWGGRADPPTIAIVDWRNVPTWSEFEILQDAFVARGVPTVVCDPRDVTFENGALLCGARHIDILYRRVLINDIVARREECAALLQAYEARRVCVANTFRCELAHKKAFFAVLTTIAMRHCFQTRNAPLSRRTYHGPELVADTDTVKKGRGSRCCGWSKTSVSRSCSSPTTNTAEPG